MIILNKLRLIVKWMVVAFFGTTILAVVAYRFLPVYVTPLMIIRLVEQMKEGKELRLHHHWVQYQDF